MTIPDEAVQAAYEAMRSSGIRDERSTKERAKDALTAALPFLQGVKVKAMEWVKPPLSETLSRCETEFGTYRTWTHDEANGKWFWSVEGGYNEVTGEATDEEVAKAAAQADYEARILSALEPFANSYPQGANLAAHSKNENGPDHEPSPRAQALEEAALYHDDLAAQHEAVEYASAHHETMAKSHRRDAAAIRSLIAKGGSDA